MLRWLLLAIAFSAVLKHRRYPKGSPVTVVSKVMASKFDRYLVLERNPAYRPVVAEDKVGGYSAEDVNRLLLDAEQIFDAQLRKVEERARSLRVTLATRERELADLANLADQRSNAAEAELTARASQLEEQAGALAKLEAELKAGAAALARQKDESALEQQQQAGVIADLEQTLCDMRASRSWRLTRPLRWLARGRGRG